MPDRFKADLKTGRRHVLGLGAVLLLSACAGTSLHFGAAATKIEAKQVVALIYAQKPDPEIRKLTYSGGDLTRAVKRLRDRYPQLKPWLDEGVIGNTANGYVALRDPSRRAEVRDIVSKENRDRSLLYHETSDAVGQDDEHYPDYLAYVSFTFGSEWIGQGPAGWWWLDERRQWQRK
ncbi:MAG: YdbL family protein [Sulfuritalea sp.]|nr:YdbL family protein [Sulfuritalea sp.]